MVKIVTDTTSGLPEATAALYDIPVIPQVVVFGEEQFLECVEMDNAEFMARLKASRDLPKTAAPSPEAFIEVFQRLVPSGEPILCIHPSEELSGTIRAVTVAKAEFPDADIRIFDTRAVASPVASMVTLAAKWAAAGVNADAIEARLRDMMARCRIYFVVATLEYLAKGGRIGGATALLGGVLQVKPILTIADGRAEIYDRERTQKRAVARLKQLVLEQISRNGDGYLSIMHADAPELAQAVADDLKAELGLSEVPILDVPPAIVVHAGPGVLGVGFFVPG